jgi:hypothetical protein
VTDLVQAAFRALGPAARRHEVEVVARALRESDDAEALALFGLESATPVAEPVFDQEACSRVQEIAEAAGAGPFVGLDLYTEMANPGWSPFPTPSGADARAGARASS